MTVPQLLIHGLQRSPDTTAIVHGEQRYTRQQLADEISTYGQVLAEIGLGPGNSFAILAPSRISSLIAQIAGQLSGARMTLLSATASMEDLIFIIENAQIDYLLIDAEAFPEQAQTLGRIPLLRATVAITGGPDSLAEHSKQYTPQPLQAPDLDPEAISSIAYTGGTTGRPKGVMSTYRSGATLTQIQMAEWQWPSPLRTLICTPLTHAGGTLFLPTLLRGGYVVVLDRFTPESFFRAVAEHRITATMLVPTMINALLQDPEIDDHDLSSLETIFYGAAPIRPALLQRAIDRFGPVMFQFYGQTECGMSISVLRKEDHHEETLDTCGRPVPWLDVTVRDDTDTSVPVGGVGEICVRGPLVMAGYWNLPEATGEAFRGGWLRTGDLGRFDDAGFLTIVDRNKDMIVTGGFNVYSAEVESVLTDSEQVVDAAVIGLPDEHWGEVVTALIVESSPGAADPEALTASVRERKGAIHAPKHMFVVPELPKTPLGKIDKNACVEIADGLRG